MRTLKLQEDPQVVELANQLREQFRNPPDYGRLRQECEAAVATWEWATDEYYSVEPLSAELSQLSRGKLLRNEPAKKVGKFQFGFDDSRQLCLSRRWGGDRPSFETFVRSSANESEFWRFANGSRAVFLGRVLHHDGAPKRVIGVGSPPNWAVTDYTYERGQIARVRRFSHGWPDEVVFEVAYDGLGDLLSITHQGVPVFTQPTRPLKDLLAHVEERLITLIPEVVAAAAPSETAFALALGFNPESLAELLPPQLGIGLESNRRTEMQANEPELEAIWNPIRFPDAPTPSPFPLEAPAFVSLNDICAQVEAQLVQGEAVDSVEKLLIRVAKKLNTLNWGETLDTTDDFIVYPVDYEAVTWREYIEKCVPAAKLKRLRAAGFLG